ncbi:Na+/H+ antiporter NhaA [Seleniivibrio woodruffii]|uniref:Na(+)/H(+) antiporter NhaA n=1 Tax=Seleniivibrio woodruffii TaxID=1078050 RepID=A0A4R1KDA0_9BACT|nr:Na+/H+ antiporter NhaA [Seleniivibrio woodruffii]TCK62628.1 sodium/proton antiporter (NhaA family) [Seleniivibrio woodruffii]
MQKTVNRLIFHTLDLFGRFLKLESSSSILMIGAMVLALILANTAASEMYLTFFSQMFGVTFGAFSLYKPLILWINDGLMALFFLMVGLEVKREFVHGELSTPSQAMLPIVAAVGGAVVPALIYAGLNVKGVMSGWGVPMATDIAFAIGLLTLLGSGVPTGLKVFLASLAVVDDLLAVLVIALFYTDTLVVSYLIWAVASVLVLFAMNRFRVALLGPYLLVGAVLWYCLLKSGIHATVAGVVTAMFIPSEPRIPMNVFSRMVRNAVSRIDNDEDKSLTKENEQDMGRVVFTATYSQSPMSRLEHSLHSLTAYFIMPVFAFSNMGLTFNVGTLSTESWLMTAGIAAGLIVGKPLGIVGSVALLMKTGKVSLPDGVTMPQIIGAGMLAGVGLTMSIFISTMAFPEEMQNISKLAILGASLVSALLGLFYLKRHIKKAD